MNSEHSSHRLDEDTLIDSYEHDEPLNPDNAEENDTELDNIELDDTELDNIELDNTELDETELDNIELDETDIDARHLDEFTRDDDEDPDSPQSPANSNDLNNMTIFELEHKLLLTFTKLCDILEQLPSTSPQLSAISSTANTLKSPTPAELFATAIHMAKSKNDVGAAKWMRRAAMSGHVRAQYYLGLMFAKGSGLPQSEFHAFTWLALAESQGSIEAVEAIAKLHSHLCTKQIKDARTQAATLYEQIHDQHFL